MLIRQRRDSKSGDGGRVKNRSSLDPRQTDGSAAWASFPLVGVLLLQASVELCKHALRNLESLHKWIGSAFPEVGIPASDKSQAVIPHLALRLTVPSRIIMGCRPEPPHTVCRINIKESVGIVWTAMDRA